jgi:hypothetical protein
VNDLGPFFAVVANQVLPELAKLDAESAGIRHWFVIEDGRGLEITEADEGTDSSHALQPFASSGVNAAYVTYAPGPAIRAHIGVRRAGRSDKLRPPAELHRSRDE